MNRATQVGFLGGVAALTLTGVGYGQTGTAEMDELKARLAAAEARISQMQTADGDQWLTETRANEIRGLVYDVLADADTRSSLLQGGAMAGYQDGFVINSTDGNFSLKINGLLQARAVLNYQEHMTGAGNDSTKFGFENSRAQLRFSGHAVNPSWTYAIEGDFADAYGGAAVLLDGYVNKDFGNGWDVTMGQFKTPLMRESLVGDGYQLAVDRSLMEFVFNGGAVQERTQGVMVGYNQDDWRAHFSFNDGLGNSNALAVTGPDTEYAFGGRFEYKFMGNWDQFMGFTSPTGEETGFLLGIAAHAQNGEYGTTATGETESFTVTVDGSWEGGGASIYGAFVYNTLDNDLPMGIDSDRYGFLVQGSYYFAEDFEVFGRYEFVDFDLPSTAVADDSVSIFTVGFNKYFAGQKIKWTSDVGWAFDTVPAAMADTSRGWRADSGIEDGQYTIRTQIQLMF